MFKDSLDAHTAARSTPMFLPSNPVLFDKIYKTVSSSFNVSISSLVIATSCLFWMHLSADVPAHTPANFYLRGVENNIAIWRNHTAINDNETIYRTGIVNISAGSTVQLVSE